MNGPRMSVADAYERLTAPGMPFEMQDALVDGNAMRVYRHIGVSLRDFVVNSRRWADRTCIVYLDERLSYDAHLRAVATLARRMQARYQISKGDHVAICMRNLPEWSIAFWAIQAIGGVAVILNAWGTGPELVPTIRHARPKLIFLDEQRIERLQNFWPELQPLPCVAVRSKKSIGEDCATFDTLVGDRSRSQDLQDELPPDPGIDTDCPAVLLYTSGTTGRSKAVRSTHRNLLTGLRNGKFLAAWANLRNGDPIDASAPSSPIVSLLTVPLFHVTGCLSVMISAFESGSTLVYMHKWDAAEAVRLVEAERINIVTGVPAMMLQFVEAADSSDADTSCISLLSYGGAAAPPDLVSRLIRAFPGALLGHGYGATEASAGICANSGVDYLEHPDSIGFPMPCCDVRVVDESGRDVNTGEIAELWARGPNLVREYWNADDEDKREFRDGWYRTGDIVRRDDEGRFYVVDRRKDMLIRGGENIYCIEIESALTTHPDVIDAAAFGIPDKLLGEVVGAAIRVRSASSLDREHVMQHLQGILPKHKIPSFLRIQKDELPKGATGKTLKTVLRENAIEHIGRKS